MLLCIAASDPLEMLLRAMSGRLALVVPRPLVDIVAALSTAYPVLSP
jgi:hypothetical protein